MADVLVGYIWDKALSRYRNADNQRFVSRVDINNLLRTTIQGAESRLADLATAYYEGSISPATFVEQMRTEVRRNELQNIALAIGGIGLLTAALFGVAGNSLRNTYAKIIGTAQDVADGKVSLPQLLNRVDGYVGEGRRLYYQTARENAPGTPEGMTTIERRILATGSESCQDCIDYYEQGWQIAGMLPTPGNLCQCRDHCRCGIMSRDVPTAELDSWLGTKN
jgi:hypothetical protein